MNRITFVICIVAMLGVSNNASAQNYSANNPDDDIRFDLRTALLTDTAFRLGLELYETPEVFIDNTRITDYVFRLLDEGEDRLFIFDETDMVYDYMIPENERKQTPKAMFNLVFAGVSPAPFQGIYYFNPVSFREDPGICHLFQDLAMNRNNPLNILDPCATYLYIVRLKSKQDEIYNESLYQKYKEHITLRSRYLLLLWDTTQFTYTPELLKNSEFVSKQLLCENQQTADIHNGYFTDGTQEMAQEPTGSEEPNPLNALPLITTISFKGDYPDSLTLSYELYDISGEKYSETSQAPLKVGIKVHGHLPEIPLISEYIRMVILKPKGYNIYEVSESPYDWKKNECTLKIRDRNPIQMEVEQIKSFDFFYIDVSKFKKRNIAITDIANKIESINNSGNSYGIYLSNFQQPMIGKKDDEYDDILRAASTLNPDLPTAKLDQTNILEAFDWKELVQTNKEVRFHYYISRPTYDLYNKELIVNLLKQIKNKRWEVYIYSDSSLKEIKPANNNYHYMNLLKP